MTLIEKLAKAHNRPSGFDYMRLVLALSVVSLHFVTIDYGDTFTNQFWHTWRRPLAAIVLPMFFALSGYLVAGGGLLSTYVVGRRRGGNVSRS
jgi:peptidoglycan/LPS O-acetylase OafA/YrhL